MDDGNFEERAREGEKLSCVVGAAGVDERLLQLLLDPSDTAVTYRTASALLDRRDDAGVELVVRASVAASDDDTREWLGAALLNFRAASLGGNDDFLRRSLGALAAATEVALGLEALELRAWLDL